MMYAHTGANAMPVKISHSRSTSLNICPLPSRPAVSVGVSDCPDFGSDRVGCPGKVFIDHILGDQYLAAFFSLDVSELAAAPLCVQSPNGHPEALSCLLEGKQTHCVAPFDYSLPPAPIVVRFEGKGVIGLPQYVVDLRRLSPAERESAFQALQDYSFLAVRVFGETGLESVNVTWTSTEDFKTSPVYPKGCPCRLTAK